jgi:hypothetical protein
MPATFEKSKGDQTWFWLVVYVIESRRIAIELVSKDTAFGTKHLLDVINETATHRKDRRDLKTFDDDGPAAAIYLFRNFSGATSLTNTVIQYNSASELHLLLAKVAEKFGKVSAWPTPPKLQTEKITFPTACVRSVGATNNLTNEVKLGAFLKGQSANTMTIVIKHLGGG